MIKKSNWLHVFLCFSLFTLSLAAQQNGQGQGNGQGQNGQGQNGGQDPGVQAGTRTNAAGVSTGGSLIPSNDNSGYAAFFVDGQRRFADVESVTNSPTGNNGLGPRFNSNSCKSCHAQPASGGSGPAMNPQFAFAGTVAPNDTTPPFITATGPTREARFPFFVKQNGQPDTNSPNGGVEDLFTITGRSDAASCQLQQPNFQQAMASNNVIYRIPTPTFGTGLIENLDDSTLLQNQQKNLSNQ